MYDNPLIVGGAAITPVVLGARFTRVGERLLAATGLDPLLLVVIAVASLAAGLLLLRLLPNR